MDINVRESTPGDIEAMVRVRIDTWRSAYRGILPQSYLDELSYEDNARFWREVLWEKPEPRPFAYVADTETGEIAGIAMAGRDLESDPVYQGQIYVLYVLPRFQNQGAGRKLVSACACRLLSEGIQALRVWVISNNPYRRFYESLGGTLVGEKVEEVAGQPVTEVSYGWTDIRVLVIDSTAV